MEGVPSIQNQTHFLFLPSDCLMRTGVVMQQDDVLSKFSTAFESGGGLLNHAEP
jgi:hypothetical protein